MSTQHDRQYEIVLKLDPPARLADDSFTATLDKKYNRKPHPDKSVESTIAALWEVKLAKQGANIWNATKFRLGDAQDRAVRLGVTDYKTHQGTTMARGDPLSLYGSEQHLANALGNGCVVVTKDHYVPFIHRSTAVGEGAGMMALPGGHAEPSKLGIHSVDEFDRGCAPAVAHADLMHELYDSIVQEVVEELHIPMEHLDAANAQMLGLVRRLPDMRYQLVMALDCFLTKDEIMALWRKGTALEGPAAESVHVAFVAVDCLQQVVDTGVVEAGQLMPEHWAGVDLYLQLAGQQ